MKDAFRCGYVAIVGRPNVGKSTLLNRLIGQKLSITSRKPQTTRHQILGIKSREDAQIIYVDTPGINKTDTRALHRYLNKSAKSIIQDVHVILFVIDALKWNDEDEVVLSALQQSQNPVILVINKVDKVKDKDKLLPFLNKVQGKADFVEVVPVSATKSIQTEQLEEILIRYLPESEPYYPDDQLTTRSSRFVAGEIIREKMIRLLGDELPYVTSVEIEKFEDTPRLLKLHALIWVERDNQKSIVIGKNGEMLKKIGTQARLDLEKFFDKKVHLQTWVKVKTGWSDDERALQQLGYVDDH